MCKLFWGLYVLTTLNNKSGKIKPLKQQIYLPTQSASADSGTVSVIELKALVASSESRREP